MIGQSVENEKLSPLNCLQHKLCACVCVLSSSILTHLILVSKHWEGLGVKHKHNSTKSNLPFVKCQSN